MLLIGSAVSGRRRGVECPAQGYFGHHLPQLLGKPDMTRQVVAAMVDLAATCLGAGGAHEPDSHRM